MKPDMPASALQNVRVAGFTWLTTGPTLTKFLADHGATVVKVETGTRPELLRMSPPYKDDKPGVNTSGYFNFANGNEYSISLNLASPDGLRVARRLVQWADVVVENFRPGVLKRLGLGYDDIRKTNPGVIMLSITMVGQQGPYAQQPGIGVQLVSYAGFTNVTGWADRGPTQPYGAYTDIPAPALGAAVLMSALVARQRTGEGRYIDVSQLETGLWFLAPLVLDRTVNGREGSRHGNSCNCACPHGAYPCRGEERWVAIAVFRDDEWRTFCRCIGDPPWTKSPDFATFLGRRQYEEALDQHISSWTCRYEAEEVMTRLQSAGIDAGVVQNAGNVLADPQLRARGHFWKMNHPALGDFSHLGQSFILSDTPARPRLPSPLLGEHTEHVCREFLGMPDGEYTELLAQGAFD